MQGRCIRDAEAGVFVLQFKLRRTKINVKLPAEAEEKQKKSR